MLRMPRKTTLLVRAAPFCIAALWTLVFVLLAYLNSLIEDRLAKEPGGRPHENPPLSYFCMTT